MLPPVYGFVMKASPCPSASSFRDQKHAGREAPHTLATEARQKWRRQDDPQSQPQRQGNRPIKAFGFVDKEPNFVSAPAMCVKKKQTNRAA